MSKEEIFVLSIPTLTNIEQQLENLNHKKASQDRYSRKNSKGKLRTFCSI